MKKKFLFVIVFFISIIIFGNLSLSKIHAQSDDEFANRINRIAGLSNLGNEPEAVGEPFVSNMLVSSDGKVVNISWDGILDDDIAYKVYRANVPIATKSILSNDSIEVAYILSSTSDGRAFNAVDIPTESGFYYYAISTSILGAVLPIGFLSHTANVDITVEPVHIDVIELPSDAYTQTNENVGTGINLNIEATNPLITDVQKPQQETVVVPAPVEPVAPSYVNGIATRLYGGNNVAISWDVIGGDDVEYAVYRAHAPISSANTLMQASKVASTRHSFVNDRLNAEIDTYYYVTSSKSDNGVFVSGENYTVQPVMPTIERYQQVKESTVDPNRTVYYKVNSLVSKVKNNKALLEWRDPAGLQNNEYHYLLFTSTSNFYTGQNVITDSFLSMAKKLVPNEVQKDSSGVVRYIDEEASELVDEPIYHSLVVVANGSVPTVVLGKGMYTEFPIVLRDHVDEEPKEEAKEEHTEVDTVSDEKDVEGTSADTTNTETLEEPKESTNVEPTQTEKPKPVVRDTLAEDRALYRKASAEFNKRNYAGVKKILESRNVSSSNKKLYYDTNLILGISYYRLKDKNKALSTLRNIRDISPSEVDFWVGQILSDL